MSVSPASLRLTEKVSLLSTPACHQQLQQKPVCALVSTSQTLRMQASWAEKHIVTQWGGGTNRRLATVRVQETWGGVRPCSPDTIERTASQGAILPFNQFSVINCGLTSYSHNKGGLGHSLSRRWQTLSSCENWLVPIVLWLTQLGGKWDTEMFQFK